MNVWTGIYRAAWGVLIVLIIFGIVSIFMPVIRENKALQRRVDELQDQIRQKEALTLELRAKQDRFQSDPKFVENIAREEFGKAKPGETVFRFSERK